MRNYTKRTFREQLAQKLTITLVAIVGTIVVLMLMSIANNKDNNCDRNTHTTVTK